MIRRRRASDQIGECLHRPAAGADEPRRGGPARMSLSAIVLEFNMLVALLGGGLALQRRSVVPGRRSYIALAFAAAAWCAGELLIERGFAEAATGMRLAMLGMTLIGPF